MLAVSAGRPLMTRDQDLQPSAERNRPAAVADSARSGTAESKASPYHVVEGCGLPHFVQVAPESVLCRAPSAFSASSALPPDLAMASTRVVDIEVHATPSEVLNNPRSVPTRRLRD